jgi:hypothetical protein
MKTRRRASAAVALGVRQAEGGEDEQEDEDVVERE